MAGHDGQALPPLCLLSDVFSQLRDSGCFNADSSVASRLEKQPRDTGACQGVNNVAGLEMSASDAHRILGCNLSVMSLSEPILGIGLKSSPVLDKAVLPGFLVMLVQSFKVFHSGCFDNLRWLQLRDM